MSDSALAASSSAAIASLSASIHDLASASASVQNEINEIDGSSSKSGSLRIVGIVLAIASGFFIGSSFVFKKKGLIASEKKSGNAPGTGTAYLKSFMWWIGMILLVVGEICNFVAYSFTDAILVTPMGALSVVVCAILSAIFLKEYLSFFGKIGCALCIIGSTVIALNGPEEDSARTIDKFQSLALAPGFLVWLGLTIGTALFLIFVVGPRWGQQNMLVYIMICSLFGGLSVSTTSGLGAAIVTSIQGDNQVTHYFFWILFAFVAVTLVIELIFLNKALALFNTAMVTPTYYVIFTFLTLVTSGILNQGFKAPVTDLITIVLGFLTICGGITILQMSKIDPETLPLDRRTTMLLSASKSTVEPREKDTDLEDPGVDSVRGGFGAIGSIYRARSVARAQSLISDEGVRSSRVSSGGTVIRRPTLTPTTMGLQNLNRHTLYDSPMPEDAMSRISMHSSQVWPKSPKSPPLEPPGSADIGAMNIHHQQNNNNQAQRRSATVAHSPRQISIVTPRNRYPTLGPEITTSPTQSERKMSDIWKQRRGEEGGEGWDGEETLAASLMYTRAGFRSPSQQQKEDQQQLQQQRHAHRDVRAVTEETEEEEKEEMQDRIDGEDGEDGEIASREMRRKKKGLSANARRSSRSRSGGSRVQRISRVFSAGRHGHGSEGGSSEDELIERN